MDILRDGRALGGQSGEAIFNRGKTVLERVTVAENRASNLGGGIYSTGSLEVSDSVIRQNESTGNGGAIYSCQDLVVRDSFLGENEAADDLVQVFQLYDEELLGLASWRHGDWNCDGFGSGTMNCSIATIQRTFALADSKKLAPCLHFRFLHFKLTGATANSSHA